MINDMQKAELALLEVSDAPSVYSGKDGACCCGCKGKHSYNSKHTEWSGKNRGYAVKAEDVNDKQVKRVLKIVQERANELDTDMGENYFSTVVGQRLYIVYLKK